jgi:hypothetical protein
VSRAGTGKILVGQDDIRRAHGKRNFLVGGAAALKSQATAPPSGTPAYPIARYSSSLSRDSFQPCRHMSRSVPGRKDAVKETSCPVGTTKKHYSDGGFPCDT